MREQDAASPNEVRVLVVDDNEQNRALARMTLEEEGYAITLASGGEEALALFALDPPDCVLLDVRMPRLDGYAVCERIRSMPGGAEVPVLFLTALRDVETFDRAAKVGGTDFLTKPVQPAELVLRVQQALRLRRLDAELRAQYDALRRQRDELYRLQLLKEDLANFIVHDLKNPVGSIDLQAQLILRDRALSERSREGASRIRAEVRDLLRLILNLLDTTRGEQGQLAPSPAPLDLRAVIGEVLEARAAQAEAQGVTLRAEVRAPTLRADADLLRRVLENLVENAIRHAPQGSMVSVEAVGEAGSVELRVADRGVGVPEAMREAIFDRFVQLAQGDDARGRTGRGLGLAFCKLAVEAHGGRIWVEEARPGALFCARFPAGDTGSEA
jgi:two-component system sensor histidine kinase/response regulator